jgi:non-ribosomal peptide synthetase component F
MLEKSEQMLIAILGVLKSGGAYVPIDPKYPAERVNHILADSKCKVIIDSGKLTRFESEKDYHMNTNPKKVSHLYNLAYIIYTSGSTGKPKGVMIEHKSLACFLESSNRKFNLTPKKL